MAWLIDLIQILLTWIYPEVPQMSPQRLKTLLDQGQIPIVLDARRRAEYGVSHLPQAEWAPKDLHTRDLPPTPPGHPVVVYCSIGVRSTKLARRLRRQGIHAVNLKGSIFQWAIEGRPLVGPGASQGWVHPYNDLWGVLLPTHHRASPELIAAVEAGDL